MRTSVIRIGLLGVFGTGNLGNDASLEAMLLLLREVSPEAEITCISPNIEPVAATFGIRVVHFSGIRSSRRSFAVLDRLLLGVPRRIATALHPLRQIGGFDVLIVPGTGALDDYGTGPRGWPFGLFTWCLAARLRRVKLLFVSVGAGPIAHPLSRWLMKSSARMASHRSYRDTASKQFMASIGLDTSADPIYPDIVFRLPDPEVVEPSLGGSQPMTVGLGVMAYRGWQGDTENGGAIYETYVAKLARFLLWLLEHGYRVRFLVGKDDDQSVIDDLVDVVNRELSSHLQERLVAEPVQSLHELMEQILETQAVVATRFHNIVCAVKLCRPAISIGYAEKNRLLMTEMGVGDFCQDIEQLDVELLIEQFRMLMSNRLNYEERMRQVNETYRTRLARQTEFFKTEVF